MCMELNEDFDNIVVSNRLVDVDVFYAQIDVSGERFIVSIIPPESTTGKFDKASVIAYHSTDGTETVSEFKDQYPGHIAADSSLELVASKIEKPYVFRISEPSLASVVSEVLNEAICIVENQQEKQSELLQEIQDGLQETKNVHTT